MALSKDNLLQNIIIPTLQLLDLDSEAARNLLMGTCAQESAMGKYVRQINGPALGIYQMEPTTYQDIWDNFLKYNDNLTKKVHLISSSCMLEDLIYDYKYATAMARIKYLRVKQMLPDAHDILGLARYWKQYYNTPKGKGTVEEFMKNYQLYVNG